MKITMLLLSIATGYLSYIMADGFLFAVALITLVLSFTVKHWVGRDD